MPAIDKNDFPYPTRNLSNTEIGDLVVPVIVVTGQTDANTITAINSSIGGSTGQVHYTDSAGLTSFTGPGSSGQVLTSGSAFQVLSIPTSTPNISGGLTGQIPVQTAPSTTSFIPTTTAGFVLTSNGAGVAPTFQATVSPSTLPKVTVLSAGTSFTSTVGAVMMKVELYGAGGGGGMSVSGSTGGTGGGSGAYARGYFLPGTYSYTLGAAGAGQATLGVSGGNGGTSTWSSGANLMTVPGGGGGPSSEFTYAGIGATAPTGAGVSFGCGGGCGEGAGNISNSGVAVGGCGGSSYAGGGGSSVSTTSGASASLGVSGIAPGSGGGGAAGASSTSGFGGPSQLIITEYF